MAALLARRGWWRWGRWCGSYPAAIAIEPLPTGGALVGGFTAAGACLDPRLPPPVAVVAAAYLACWFGLLLAHGLYYRACRRHSRQAGLGVIVLVPESVRLVRWLFRRRGVASGRRRCALAVHVDVVPGRTTGRRSPLEAAREFGRCYRRDYDRLLGDLAGRDVLVASSTFNRHESCGTRAAVVGGWCQTVSGPLLRGAPRRHPPAERRRVQRLMFGGVVSERRVDRREAWRARLFDCRSGAEVVGDAPTV